MTATGAALNRARSRTAPQGTPLHPQPNYEREEDPVSQNTTEPPPAATDLVQRNGYMAALSLAEQLISEMTALPHDFTMTVPKWAPTMPQISFYFHKDLPGLRQFRDAQDLTESTEIHKDSSLYIEATRNIRGVRVVAWTLTGAPESAVAA